MNIVATWYLIFSAAKYFNAMPPSLGLLRIPLHAPVDAYVCSLLEVHFRALTPPFVAAVPDSRQSVDRGLSECQQVSRWMFAACQCSPMFWTIFLLCSKIDNIFCKFPVYFATNFYFATKYRCVFRENTLV